MLRDILLDQKEELEERFRRTKKVVEREFLSSYKEFINSKQIKVTTGIRRCGKSFSTYLLLRDKKFAYANFDEKILSSSSHQDIISTLFEVFGDVDIFFFDEIQNLNDWEFLVNKLHRSGYNVFITGSNARLLSKELSDRLTGRHIDIEIFPFSFREFLIAREFKEDIRTTKGQGIIKNLLKEYINIGGFPEIIIENENPKIYLRTLFNDIVEKDIIRRFEIKNETTFREISYFLLSNAGNYVTYNGLKNSFNLGSDHTVKNYLSYLQMSYLFIFLENFSYSTKRRFSYPKKVYLIDTGFNLISFRFSENFGRLIENVVLIELLRRRSYWFNNWEIYYFKDYQQREVDFVIKEGINIKQLIQVTYASNKDEIEQREIKSLLKAYELFKDYNPELLVITWDYEDVSKIDNKEIKFIPLWKLLLNV